MDIAPYIHFKRTGILAGKLKPKDVYEWLVTKGYFPEPYVLPPCFVVKNHPKFGKVYNKVVNGKFSPKIRQYQQVHFPKTDYTDRTFGILDPEIHSDIALVLAKNWRKLIKGVFHAGNKVSAYSFPIPLNSKNPGSIGSLRSGRMIYEFIEMAENDVAAIAYGFKFIIKTDIKNFYPAIYTHSIPWAIHGKRLIRRGNNRRDYSYFGNRLDKLFQNANDGCTNGLPIGPAVSDLIAEIVLSEVDRQLSKSLNGNTIVVRFKDDYRILAKHEQDGIGAIKSLQAALKEYHLELNDEKTQSHRLPNGIFREWVSQYHAANPNPKAFYYFKRFKETYLSVVTIDRNNPGCGVIDRFLADITTKKYRLRVEMNRRALPKVLSLLLMLARLRTKAFPKVLAIIECILRSRFGSKHVGSIVDHLEDFLQQLYAKEADNRYLIAWICYFVRANGLEKKFKRKYKFADPIVRATYTSRFTLFRACGDFRVFEGVKTVSKRISMLEHLNVFKPQ
jgi:hypothetical protein